jgi:hypothetical protein
MCSWDTQFSDIDAFLDDLKGLYASPEALQKSAKIAIERH